MIRDWQRFFNTKSQGGTPDDELYEAFRAFIGQKDSTAMGPPELKMEHLRKALRDPGWPRLWMTPMATDVMHCRPYFMVPLLETSFVGEHQILWDEIAQHVTDIKKATQAPAGSPPITDLFVMSHGWHRNYFSGIAAYDRLLSRFSVLRSRGRLRTAEEPPEERDPKAFRPIFIGLHWNSDPTADDWVDSSGRRNKDSFLDNARKLFELRGSPNDGKFVTDFEDFFEYMSCVSAPDQDAVYWSYNYTAAGLFKSLNDYVVRGMETNKAGLDEKVSTVWRCYFESQNKVFVTSQDVKPKPVGSFLDAVSTLFSFLLALGLIGLPLLPKVMAWFGGTVWATQIRGTLFNWTDKVLTFLGLPETDIARTLVAGVGVAVGCGLFLAILAAERHELKRKSSARGFPILEAVLWLPFQILCTLPLLVFLLLTWFFRTLLVLLAIPVLICGPALIPATSSIKAWHVALGIVVICAILSLVLSQSKKPLKGIFREKLTLPGDDARNPRDWLAAIARFPIRKLLHNAVARDSALATIGTGLDNQFAFFELQRKGVNAGRDAGRFLGKLYAACPELKQARLHFFCHSFGGLVVLNAARTLLCTYEPAKKRILNWKKSDAKQRELRKRFENQPKLAEAERQKLTVTSLTLVQAAVASSWFYKEDELIGKIENGLACAYSRYDTANSTWYPLANNGRNAAGCVGLCEVPKHLNSRRGLLEIGSKGELALVVKPPDIVLNCIAPAQLNLDCSRIVYEGPVATGGGHSDIYKDDIVNLLWAVTQIR
jgi:hypothetical protein